MISIIIPVYNVENYIKNCIDSCLSQTYDNFEIIAVNDGSTDSSGKILDLYKDVDARVKVIHKNNEGVAKTRLIGIEYSKGDYLLFLDSDDTLPSNSLELLMNSIKENNSDIAVGGYCECYENGKKIFKQSPTCKSMTTEQYIELLLLSKVANGACFKLYKRELANNLEHVYLKLGEDTVLLIQLLFKAKKISFVNRNVYNYIQRQSSAVHQIKPTYISDMFYYRMWISDFLIKWNAKYLNNELIDLYIIQGYIRCIFLGGGDYLPNQLYYDLKSRYIRVRDLLPLWERIVYHTIPMKFVNEIAIQLLYYIRRIKIAVFKILSK